MTKLVVAFDVDGTLIDAEDLPRPEVVNILNALEDSGFVDVIIWSGGGADYARMWARRLGVSPAIPCIAKDKYVRVDIAFDDVAEFNLADKIVYV